MINTLTKIDVIILSLATLLVSYSYFYYWSDQSSQADYAIIFTPNHSSHPIDLQQTQKIHIQGQLGESVFEVKEGKIRFITSPCQKKYCIHTGWLTKGGNFVTCLPNQVSVAVYSKDGAIDSIAY